MIESECFVEVNGDLQDWVANSATPLTSSACKQRESNAALRKMALHAIKMAGAGDWGDIAGFDGLEINLGTLLDISPTLAKINELYPFKAIGVIMVPRYTYYKMHRDKVGGCTVLMMVSDCPTHYSASLCVFVEDTPDQPVTPTLKLQYEQDTMYLLNTQKPHGVFNFDCDRFMLRAEFMNTDPERMSYSNVKEIFEKEGLV
jgi:hypothetical protein